MTAPADAILQAVRAAVRRGLGGLLGDGPRGLCIAFSGGLDSAVLLHVAAATWPGCVRAVHVNHQIQPQAADWAAHCQQRCDALEVRLTVLTVQVPAGTGEGPEAAARRVRYSALATELRADELLVTAHHQDDQAETLLLNLLRGSGPDGLAGAPARTPFANGWLCRPLLGVPRRWLLEYARAVGLTWIEDPSNTDTRLDRNRLRREILPALEMRWPAAREAFVRSARLAADAAGLMRELAAADARAVLRDGRIRLPALRTLSEPRQRNLLRYLCRERFGSAPPEARLREGLAQLLGAGVDRHPLLAWQDGEIRRYDEALYLLAPMRLSPPGGAPGWSLPARPGACVELGEGLGRLRLVPVTGRGLAIARLPDTLHVGLRAGGERLQPADAAHHRELKSLLRDRRILPWMRPRLPLLHAGNELVAVAHLWVAAGYAAVGTEPGLAVQWEQRPPID